jgi:hypothetical protein
VSKVNKAGELRAVDRLGEGVMEEGVLDAKLVHGPTPGESQSQHSLDGGGLDNGAKSLIVVHPGALGEPWRTQRALYQSREPFALSLCSKIHLTVMKLALGGRGIKSHMLLDS